MAGEIWGAFEFLSLQLEIDFLKVLIWEWPRNILAKIKSDGYKNQPIRRRQIWHHECKLCTKQIK